MAENKDNKFAKEIESLNGVIDELSKNNLKGFNKIVQATTEIETKKDDASDLAKDVLGKMKSIAEDNRKGTAGDRKKSLKEIESLQKSIMLEKDASTKMLIQSQLRALKKTTVDNSSFLERSNDFLVSHLSEIGGVITGVLADSPVLAIGTDFLIRKAQGAFAEKQGLRDQERDRAEARRDELIGKQVELAKEGQEFQEQESKVEQRVDDTQEQESKVEQHVEDLVADKEIIPESAVEMGVEYRTSLLEIISKQLSDILGVIAPLVSDAEENAREDKVFNDKLLSAVKGGPSKVEKVDEEDVGTSVLGALIMSKFITPLMGVLVSIGGIIKGFMMGLGKVFFKVLTKVFLPIMIIGGLFSGITEAIEIFKKTGSMKKAFMGFLGGILDFITFGLIGTEELKSFGSFVSDKVSFLFDGLMGILTSVFDYILKPIKKLNMLIKDAFGFDIGATAGDILKSISEGLGKLLLFMIDKIPFASKILPESLISSIEQMAGERLNGSIIEPVEKSGGAMLRSTREDTEKTRGEIDALEKDAAAMNIAAVDNSTINNTQSNSILVRPSARNDFAPLPN